MQCVSADRTSGAACGDYGRERAEMYVEERQEECDDDPSMWWSVQRGEVCEEACEDGGVALLRVILDRTTTRHASHTPSPVHSQQCRTVM